MEKDRNSINTEVPTKEIDHFVKLLKNRKCFEGIILQKIDNITCVGNKRVNSTNYKYVCVVRRGNIFTYFARISKKNSSKKHFIHWYASFSCVLEAAKAVDKKLLEHGLLPVNFNFKPKLKEEQTENQAA